MGASRETNNTTWLKVVSQVKSQIVWVAPSAKLAGFGHSLASADTEIRWKGSAKTFLQLIEGSSF